MIRDSLFSIQVEQPWLLLQFGNSNAEEIGTDRVEALVSASPEDEDGKIREEVVKTEIEDNDNNNLTIPQVVNRLGMVFFLLFFNLGITIFVFLLTGMMLFSQILFIIFAMFLPISFLLSMIPSYESMAKQAIVRVFNTIMTRAGITLIVTVAFSISSMFYNISTDYPFFMVAFLQIVCFAGIYMKLGDLMSMFSLNAGDSQSMGRRIFRRPYLFMRHRARRMEHRIARAVSAGGISGGVAGAVAGSAVANKRAERKNTASKENRGNTTSSMGQRAGSKVGAVLDTKNKVKDKANAVKENIKDMPTQTAYAVYSAKEKAKSSVSDFKRGVVQEQQSRQTGRLEKQEQHRQNIADKRMKLQKAQEARHRKTDGSATTRATRPHERPATASKPSAEKMQEVKRPATAPTPKASEPVKTNVIKERPLSSGASDRKATQSAQPVHRQNIENVVSQETRQNYKTERTTKTQTFEQSKRTAEHTEKNRNLVVKKGQKKK
ncbi:membrane protein [Clostridioides difficile]|nr:membrane protein [Clostridioides difficile]